jgi:hypothetical protein
MPFVSTVIARLLALQDSFLAQWVDASAYGMASPNECWGYQVQNASVNPCGQGFVSQVTDIIEFLIPLVSPLVPSVLGGLFSF